MSILKVESVTLENINLLQKFLCLAGESLNKFRYFESRPLNIINQHKATFLILRRNKPIAYGHLDEEDGIVWLGIAVAEDYKGLGIGRLMMNILITEAKLQKIQKITLAVDNSNQTAILLYKRMGFQEKTNDNHLKFLEKNI